MQSPYYFFASIATREDDLDNSLLITMLQWTPAKTTLVLLKPSLEDCAS